MIAVGGNSGQATFADVVTLYSGPATTVQFGDIDGDGIDEDLFVAEGGRHSGGTNSRVFAWFEAPNWIRHDISVALGPFTGDSDLVDIDDDGDLDVVIATDSHSSQSSSDAVYWYENTGSFEDNWPQHTIEFNVPDAFHIGDLETGDIDGDGKIDVVIRHLSTLRFVVYFQNTIDDWQARRLDTRHREGLAIADLDQNGRDDIIGNGYILFAPLNPRTEEWTEVIFDASFFDEAQSGLNNSVKSAIFDMDGDAKLDIIMSSAEGNDVHLAWYKNPSNAQNGIWQRHIIEQPQGKNHQVQIADIDLDGDPDVYGGFSFGDSGVFWWENINGSATNWQRHTIDNNRGCYSCIATDFDHDGDIDFAGPQKYTGQVNLYENTTAMNTLTVDVNSMLFNSMASMQNITISADIDWGIVLSEPWLSVDQSSGSGNDQVVVSVSGFSGIGERQGLLTISGGGITRNVMVIQTGLPDNQAPSIPQNLSANHISHNQVQLLWSPSVDNSGSVAGYNIYQDNQVINQGLIQDSSFLVTGLTAQTVYEFEVSALDSSNNESDFSDAELVETDQAPIGPQAWAYWPLDDDVGLIAVDAVGQNHGDLINMAGSQWQDSPIGGALNFDGIDDLIDLGMMNLPGDELTVMAWIRPDDLESHTEGRIISKASGLSGNDHEWMVSTIEFSGEFRLRFRLKINGTTQTLIATQGAIVPNEWAHVAASFGADGVMKLYKNAQLVGSMTNSGNLSDSTAPVAIGNQPSADRPFSGTIDDVCIFAQALDIDELAQIYNDGNARPCMQLVSNQVPVAHAGMDIMVIDVDGSGDEAAKLDASSSTDADGAIINYQWTEGDVEHYSGAEPQIVVDLPVGNHTLLLTVTDDQGAIDLDQTHIIVEPQPDAIAPVIVQPGIINIADGSAEGTVVITLVADDENALRDWAIISGNESVDGDSDLPFFLNPLTGELSINDSGDINYGLTEEFTIDVVVSDGINISEPEQIIIRIDSNDVIFISGFE